MTVAAVVAYDPLRDSRHKSARAARAVADWLSWLTIEGKAPRTLDDYERTAAALLRMYPDKDADQFTDGDLLHLLILAAGCLAALALGWALGFSDPGDRE